MEAERAAVKQAIELLGHQAIMAEDFGARASSPQVACLSGVRDADLVILVLGPRYGTKQAGGVSATHEEVREARSRKPLLMFVQSGVEAEPDQAELIKEIGKWQGGQLWDGFVSADDLGQKATRAIHRFQLTQAVAPSIPKDCAIVHWRSSHGSSAATSKVARSCSLLLQLDRTQQCFAPPRWKPSPFWRPCNSMRSSENPPFLIVAWGCSRA